MSEDDNQRNVRPEIWKQGDAGGQAKLINMQGYFLYIYSGSKTEGDGKISGMLESQGSSVPIAFSGLCELWKALKILREQYRHS